MSKLYYEEHNISGGAVGMRAVNALARGSMASREYRRGDVERHGVPIENVFQYLDLPYNHRSDFVKSLQRLIAMLPSESIIYGYCSESWVWRRNTIPYDAFMITRGTGNHPNIRVGGSEDNSEWFATEELAACLTGNNSWRNLDVVIYLHDKILQVVDPCDVSNTTKIFNFSVDNENAVSNNSTRSASNTAGGENQPVQEDQNMSKVQNIVAANKNAAISAAKLEAGRIALVQVTNVIKTKAPYVVKGYIDTPVGRAVVANLFSFAVAQYASNNRAAVVLSDAAMQAAALEIIQSFNIEQMITDVVNGVGADKLAKLSGELEE